MLVISQPDRPRGRGRRVRPSPVSALARSAGLSLLRPARVGDPAVEAKLRECAPDLGVVVAFGQFLPRRIRQAPSLGYLINAHASLLPKHRGAAPIARAILEGEKTTGVSVMRVEREMDAGPVAVVRETPIGSEESAGDLETRLAEISAEAIAEAIALIAASRDTWTPQDDSRACLAPKLERDDARLDWSEPAERLTRRVRAMAPKPGAFTALDGRVLRILRAECLSGPVDAAPGAVRLGGDPPLRIATGDGWLAPVELQREGKRPLGIREFLRGRPIPDGARLGGAPSTARLGS